MWNQSGMNVNKLTLDLKLHLKQQLKNKNKNKNPILHLLKSEEGRLELSSIKKINNEVTKGYREILSTCYRGVVYL